MKYNEIKDLTVDELKKRQANLKEDLFLLKMKHSLGQINNPLEIRSVRKDQAKICTALNMKLSR